MYHISLSISGVCGEENACVLRVGEEFFALTTKASINEIKAVAADTNITFYKSHYMQRGTELTDIGDDLTEKELFLLIWGLTLNRRYRAKSVASAAASCKDRRISGR